MRSGASFFAGFRHQNSANFPTKRAFSRERNGRHERNALLLPSHEGAEYLRNISPGGRQAAERVLQTEKSKIGHSSSLSDNFKYSDPVWRFRSHTFYNSTSSKLLASHNSALCSTKAEDPQLMKEGLIKRIGKSKNKQREG